MNARPILGRTYKTVLGLAYSAVRGMPDCGISSTTSTTEQLGRVDIVAMDEIDWNGR